MSFSSPIFILHAILLCACLAHSVKGELDESVERLIQEEIGKKIERIKQEIKKEIETRERNRRIEANNQKFDELQQQELLEDREQRQQQTGVLNDGKGRDNLDVVGSVENLSKSQAEEESAETLRSKRDEVLDSSIEKDAESSLSGGATVEGDSSSAQSNNVLGSKRSVAKQGNFLFQGEESRLDDSERERHVRKFRRPYGKLRRRRRRKIRVPKRRRRRKIVKSNKTDPENNLPSLYEGSFPDIVHKGGSLSRYKRVR